MKAHLQIKQKRAGKTDTLQTVSTECKEKVPANNTGPWHRIPSNYMVKHNNRWHRVYMEQINLLTISLYIGKTNPDNINDGEVITVTITL